MLEKYNNKLTSVGERNRKQVNSKIYVKKKPIKGIDKNGTN